MLMKCQEDINDMTANNSKWDSLFRADFSDQALATVMKFLLPDFIEKDGFVLLKEQHDVLNLQDIALKYKGNKREVEKAINCVDFTDVFDCRLVSAELQNLVKQVAELWRWHLKTLFPNKIFDIEVVDFSDDGAWGIIVAEAK